jgi:RNA polymerase sigma factor (TIGR02999 family)
METSGDITQLLGELRDGKPGAADRLLPLVYDELRRLAAGYMSRERPDHSLQATALVHEAYLRLIDQRQNWQNRAHFFGVCAHLMRLILVDHARRHRSGKRGGVLHKVPLEQVLLFAEEQYDDLLALDEALERLAARDPRMVRVVELRFFADLSVEETATVLGVSQETVKRDWRVARTWLHAELSGAAPAGA